MTLLAVVFVEATIQGSSGGAGTVGSASPGEPGGIPAIVGVVTLDARVPDMIVVERCCSGECCLYEKGSTDVMSLKMVC